MTIITEYYLCLRLHILSLSHAAQYVAPDQHVEMDKIGIVQVCHSCAMIDVMIHVLLLENESKKI